MSAVLRIALSTFSIVPLQRALNTIGVVVAVPALIWELIRPASTPIATFFMAMGILLIVLTPLFGGGPALRFASTPSLLHLRPHGRRRVLLGAALGVTLVAALVTLPFLVQQLLYSRGAPQPPDIPVTALFTVMWLCTALVWAGLFAMAGAPRQLLPFLFMLPLAVGPIARYVGTSRVAVMVFVFGTLAALLAWVVWYASTDIVRRSGMCADPMLWGFGSYVVGQDTQPMASRDEILRRYLLGASRTSSALSGVLVLGFVALVTVLPNLEKARASGPNPFIVLVLAALGIMAATLANTIARRARLLWLRAGLDRAALFALAEREGLISCALAYCIPVAALIGFGIFTQPGSTTAYLAYGLVSLASAQCLFHAGLATTRNWDAADITLMAGLVVLQVVLTVLTRPGAENSVAWALGFSAALAVLAQILRAYARRRWQLLDWRVMRMLQTRR